MTTAFDETFVPLALRLVAKFGVDMLFTINEAVDGGYDRTTGDVTPTDVAYTRKASPPAPINKKYVNGDTIRESDMEIWVAASGIEFTPVVGMLVTHVGQAYRATVADPFFSGDSIAAYRIIVRS